MSEVFVSTDVIEACLLSWCGRKHDGRIPEVQVRIPSRGRGTFFPHAVSSIFRHSLTHTHTHIQTQRRSLQMLDVAVPQIGVGGFHA